MAELDKNDLLEIRYCTDDMRYIISVIDEVRKFKLGDYIICNQITSSLNLKSPLKNSYGAVMKFKIVHVDELGLPYVKAVDAKGKASGPVEALLTTNSHNLWLSAGSDDFSFELDPDYADAILLQAEDSYDPMARHNELKSMHKEVLAFNKQIKLPTSNMDEVVDTFSKLQVGMTYWTSPKKGFTVLENAPCKLTKKTVRINGSVIKYPANCTIIHKIKVRHSNGKVKTYEPADMKNKNIYAGIPRAYKDPSDSI